MTNREINEAINRFRGVKEVIGEMNALTAIAYFFLMDASYQVFNESVRTQPYRHDAKRIVNSMRDAYNAFFRKFFAAFNREQTDYLIDKADAMEESIAHNVEIARIAMMECCNEEPLDVQSKISNIWLCNRLAREAQDFHINSWKGSGFILRGKTKSGVRYNGGLFTKGIIDPNIDAVAKRSAELSLTLFGDGDNPAEKHRKRIQQAVSALTRKIYEWINNEYKSENSQEDNTSPGR